MPSQQMWIDVGRLVHDQIPDSDGHTMPADVMAGSYELRDVDHPLIGSLYEGKLVIDKTYGHAAYGCGLCCGYIDVLLIPNPFAGPPDIDNDDVIQTEDTCSGDIVDVTGAGYNWGSSNTAVATLPNRTLHTVAVGTATGGAEVELQGSGRSERDECPTPISYPTQPVSVTPSISISCSNLDLSFGSTAPASTVTGTCTTQVTPGGGTFVWSSTGGTISLTPSQNGSSATYSSAAASTKVGDTTITVKYTYQSQSASATSSAITVHRPTTLVAGSVVSNGSAACTLPCLTKPGSGNCNVTSGTSCTYNANQFQREYKVYDQFNSFFQSFGIDNATVTESVVLTKNNCGGSGVTTGSSTFTDFFDNYGKCDSCCETGGPGCTTTASQTIYVNSFSVWSTTITESCTAASATP